MEIIVKNINDCKKTRGLLKELSTPNDVKSFKGR